MSDNPTPEGDEVDALLGQIAKAAEVNAEANNRVMDNHLKQTDRVIANVATLKTIHGNDDLIRALLENPT